jgi:UDP-N-acetylglucosamine acyltransferase
MSIHPSAIIEAGAVIGNGCIIHAHAMIKRHAVLEDGVVVHSYAVIGDDPQDLSFNPTTDSSVRIGARTVIREFVTVHRSTREGAATVVGADSYLMSSVHIGHDCQLAERVIIASSVLLAGHIQVGSHVFLGGGAAIHQFCRIGESAMIGGLARITRDVPPFTMATERDELVGLNKVGLRRRGFKAEAMAEIKEAFRIVCAPTGNARTIAAAALAEDRFQTVEARRFLSFFSEGRRGFLRRRDSSHASEDTVD